MIGTIAAVVLGLLLLVVLLPIRYAFSLEKWEFSFEIRVFLGLWKKKLSFDLAGDDEEEEEDVDPSLMADMLAKAEEAHQQQTKETEKTNHSGAAKPFLGHHDDEEEETDHPTHAEQLRFALHNGLLEKVLRVLGDCISHGWLKEWGVYGELGTGDPMETGLLSGMTAAFLPKETSGVVWNYLDRVVNLTGKGQGRIIPLYVIYIALKLIISKEARQFWHFRQGGTCHE